MGQPGRSPTDSERSATARPAAVWALSLLLAIGAAATLMGAAMPMSEGSPVLLDVVCGLTCLVAAATVWRLGERTTPVLVHAALAGGTVATSTIAAAAHTSGGLALTTFGYTWVSLYAAHFLSRRAAAAHAAAITVAFAAALAINDLPNRPITWAVVCGTVWAISAVVGVLTAQLRAKAETDPLTGVLNRQGLDRAARQLCALADRTDSPLGVAILDLDRFKAVNDTLGHVAGDRLLVESVAAWRATMRASDVLARHGGDEFILLLPATEPSAAEHLLDRLREESPVSFSHGLTGWSEGDTLDTALARADQELYRAKAARRAPALTI
jgi:diguanylate cyclase (GGDEF)-like protein